MIHPETGPDHRLLGKVFGLAPCCVEFYCARTGTPGFAYQYPHLQSLGGLRFCQACSQLPEEMLIDGVNARRMAPTPFPIEPGPEHLNTILNHPAWTDDERAKLVAQRRFIIHVPGEDEAGALEFYDEMTAIEVTYAAQVAREPARQAYFYALRELAKNESLEKLMDHLHAFMREVIKQQHESGEFTL